MELLNVDLNEIVSKSISERISSLEETIQSQSETIRTQQKKIARLEKDTSNSTLVLSFLQSLRASFAEIKQSETDKSGWFDSKAKNQYLFIKDALSLLYGVQQEQAGWYCHRGDGNLRTHLAVNYYNSKKQVCDLLHLLYDNSDDDIQFIKNFQMPYDWSRGRIKQYAQSPNYNTNGCIFGISQYWMEYGAGQNNVPHDLIMKSPYILEDDIFGAVLTTIKNQRAEYRYLFALPTHNEKITDDQIQQLGRCLVKIDLRNWDETIKSFARKFMMKFCDKTLDYLIQLATKDNQFNTLHWANFPTKYQIIYFKQMPIEQALKALNEYSCTLNTEEKTSLLREILTVS